MNVTEESDSGVRFEGITTQVASSWLVYGFAGCGFGIRKVHEKPNTIVRPWGRALAEYSS
jgi:hypothetical protein